jgi:hypothetical protein
MSASVRIESGIAAGTNYWIDRPVLRIGSDPNCEICVPSAELSPHTLTLEFRGGVYRAYNRGSAPVYMGSSTLQPGGVATWEDGVAATLPGELRLVLAVDGDPRPCPRPEVLADEEEEYVDEPAIRGDTATTVTAEAAQKAKSKSMVQMLVIVVCMAMTGMFLWMLNLIPEDEQTVNRPSFDGIVVSTLKDGSPYVRGLVERLQYGQALLVRGDPARARVQFAALRDQLIQQKNVPTGADAKYVQKIKDYVEGQLGQLQ